MTDHVHADAAGDYLRALLDVEFTDEQMRIITAPLAPQLVVAGAGSGKTMVMAARVVHAVAHHRVPPAEILGLTFTNKAAGELAERVRRCLARLPRTIAEPGIDDVDPYDDVPTVATYHSYAATLVRDHALRIGREPGATLMSEAVQWQLAMRVATRAPGPFSHLHWTTPYVANLIVALAGDLSDHLATADDVRRHDQKVRAAIDALPKQLKGALDIVERTKSRDELLGLVTAYDEEKKRLDVVDFGDQVALACAIVDTAPDVVALERHRFHTVVLDEYQDTGVAQRVLLSALFGGGHSVTAVGDPNQSIYGWRGASISNLTRFAEHFPPMQGALADLTLATTFRCDGRILAAANRIAAPLAGSLTRRGGRAEVLELRARPGAEDAGRVVVSRPLTAMDEAEGLAERVVAAKASGTSYGQIAVLARRRMDFARLHRAMVERDIPVEVVGLGGLLAMPEVSDIVAVLSLLNDVTRNSAAVRLLTGPRWRLGVRDLAALGARASQLAKLRPLGPQGAPAEHNATEYGVTEPEVADEQAVAGHLDDALEAATSSVDPVEVPSLLEAAESPGHARLSEEARTRLGRFVAEIRTLRCLTGQPIVDLIAEVIVTTGLDVEIEAGDPALAVARLANVHAFLDVAAQFTGLEGEADLAAFLTYLRAASDNEDGLDVAAVSDADTVKLMTVHAAKGLEWDVVAIPGLVARVFPSDRGRMPWTTGAHVLPFDCRGDRADLPVLAGYTTADFTAFKHACDTDAADEERRLAYVAMTRARHELWLSGYVWSTTRRERMQPSIYLDEVRELGAPSVEVDDWCPDPDDDAVNVLLDAGPDDVVWPVPPDPDVLARRRAGAAQVAAAAVGGDAPAPTGPALVLAEGWRRDAELLVEEIRRRRIRTVDVALPARLTTSQVVALAHDADGFAASLARPMPSRPIAQAKRGSRFHQWVEELYGAAPLLEPDDLPGAEDADISDVELAELQQRFLADGWGERRPVAVESPFEMVIGGRLVRGRIDAVYRDVDGGYDVIDYKTGAVPRDFASAALQLAIYRLAWADLANVDPSTVQAGFLYVRTGELKRPDRLLDRDRLAALLSAPS